MLGKTLLVLLEILAGLGLGVLLWFVLALIFGDF